MQARSLSSPSENVVSFYQVNSSLHPIFSPQLITAYAHGLNLPMLIKNIYIIALAYFDFVAVDFLSFTFRKDPHSVVFDNKRCMKESEKPG
jgi:hypothetical protein